VRRLGEERKKTINDALDVKQTPTNQKRKLNSLIEYHFGQEDLPDYDCQTCGKRTLETQCVRISWYPIILCIVLGCKNNDDTRITLAVNYPVWDLNLCTIFGSHEGMVGSKYNLTATVNHKARKMNDGHYTAVRKIPTPGSWYKYDDDNANSVKFVKGNKNSMLMDFQKTASILFYIDVRTVSVCYNNLHNNDEVIDRTGGGIETIHQLHKRPPGIVQLEDETSSSLSSDYSLTSVGQQLTWTMMIFFHLHLNQQKMARATQNTK
jgi:hypothetical protein